MKAIFTLFIICSSSLFALDTEVFLEEHHQINRAGMLTLGSWAIGNIAIGAVGRANTKGEAKYFHEMNAAWNLINLGIASFGYYNSFSPDVSLNLAETIKQQKFMESILLFNAGLDVGYMAIGFYLKERSKNVSNNPARLRGYGNSLILQGAFLLVFDLALYYFHSNLSSSLLKDIESIQIGFGSIQVNF